MRRNDDLELNAYVDNELSDTERVEMLAAMQRDPDLARQTCELNNLKNQLQIAYANPPAPKRRNRQPSRSRWMSVAAGLAMLCAGLIGGWYMGSYQPGVTDDRFVLLDPEGRGQAPAVADSGETRIVFHLTNPDQAIAGELLDDVEQMLQAYQQDERPLRVEIVAHGDGLRLLRARLTRHQGRVNKMAENFGNLTFVACRNTIERVQVSQGIEVKILPSAEVIDSGVDHVVKRQREGWVYIRV